MDEDNHAILMSQCPEYAQDKVQLFMSYAPQLKRREVPDPYYGGIKGFENVFDMIDDAAKGLLDDIEQRYLSRSADRRHRSQGRRSIPDRLAGVI